MLEETSHRPSSPTRAFCINTWRRMYSYRRNMTTCRSICASCPASMARGEMVRFMAVNGIKNPEEIKAFGGFDYRYDETRSDLQTYVFVRRKKEKLPEFE